MRVRDTANQIHQRFSKFAVAEFGTRHLHNLTGHDRYRNAGYEPRHHRHRHKRCQPSHLQQRKENQPQTREKRNQRHHRQSFLALKHDTRADKHRAHDGASCRIHAKHQLRGRRQQRKRYQRQYRAVEAVNRGQARHLRISKSNGDAERCYNQTGCGISHRIGRFVLFQRSKNGK